MSIFSNEERKFKKGDYVRVRYSGIEGIIADYGSRKNYFVSYMTETDEEKVIEYEEVDLEKC